MKTCEKCNASYEDDKKFCVKCGISLENELKTGFSRLNNTVLFISIMASHALNVLIWLLIQYVFIPSKGGLSVEVISKIYNTTGLINCVISIIVIGLSIYFIQGKKLKILLAFYLLIILAPSLISYFPSLFK